MSRDARPPGPRAATSDEVWMTRLDDTHPYIQDFVPAVPRATLTPMTNARIHEEGWPFGVKPPPRGRDLPHDDGEPMETPQHRAQMNLLCDLFEEALGERAFVGGNMALYYSTLQARNQDFKAPDVFVVLDPIDNPDRLSWVLWEEDLRTPAVVVELLSESTEKNDRGRKKQVYERIIRVPDYFLYDPTDHRFEGFRLAEDGAYHTIAPDAEGRLESRATGLLLGRWTGAHKKRQATWLRLFDRDGRMIPTAEEALAARAQAEAARAQAEAARAQAAEGRVQELLVELAKR